MAQSGVTRFPIESKLQAATKDYLRLIGLAAMAEIRRGFSPSGPSRPGNPPAVATGNYRRSVGYQLVGTQRLRVGVTRSAIYAIYLEHGTGLYGPERRRITPVRAKVLAWRGRGGKIIFRASIAGVRPRPLLVPAVRRALAHFKGVRATGGLRR